MVSVMSVILLSRNHPHGPVLWYSFFGIPGSTRHMVQVYGKVGGENCCLCVVQFTFLKSHDKIVTNM